MTLENAQKLLKHYNDLADGTISKPFGHKDWADVIYNAKVRAVEMQKKVDEYPKPVEVKENKPTKVKTDGKK
ncbi:hypothetical protein LCGC14_0956370 [marine sediment metagenome]|uniref:Uncharacterized protein n=1 Tax=marine sediment metagenome TaxID=412755 RepID=A0A0F9QZ42_9ZZZZ